MQKVDEIITVEKIEVKKGNLIGRGTFGIVYQGEIQNGNIVAIKKQMMINEHEKSILQILKGKKFDHLIQVQAFEEKGDGIIILMELGKRIDLKSMPDKVMTCLQMAKGVSELHKLNFFHRDLKPENFLIGIDNKIKLIDFGLAKTIAREAQTKGRGTKAYIAPEVYVTNDYNSSVDIWSLGLIFYEIFTNQQFFETNSDYEIMKQSIEITQLDINRKLEKQVKNKIITTQQKELLQKMIVQLLTNDQQLKKDTQRISIDEVINMLEKLNSLKQTQQQVQGQEYQK